MTRRTRALIATMGVTLFGCGGSSEVVRIEDGRIVPGHYIAPEAYDAYLAGALAEDSGDTALALRAYAAAAREDAKDPEVWTRIGEMRCRSSRAEAGIRAFDRALAIDSAYAPALSGRARCGGAHETKKGSAEEAEARAIDEADDARLLAGDTMVPSKVSAENARDRLVGLALMHPDRAGAWRALATWAETHDDRGLEVRAYVECVRRDPGSRARAGSAAIDLAGRGEIALARALAGAIVDEAAADGARVRDVAPLVARLAVDDAIARGDEARARLRSTRGNVPLEEVAARACLLGVPIIARAIATELVAADPTALGARFVVLATSSKPAEVHDAFATRASSRATWSAAAAIALAQKLGANDASSALLAATAPLAITPGDTLLTQSLAELTAPSR